MARYQIRQCADEACRLRYPWTERDPPAQRCPRCGAPVIIVVEQPLPAESSRSTPAPVDAVLHVLLDNVRSTFNVGSIFRSADGAGVSHLYLCGVTPTPAHPKIGKTALGAEQNLPWSHHRNALDLADQLQAQGHQLWALEELPTAEPLFVTPVTPHAGPLTLLVGNEITGVDPELLARSQRILTIPMAGHKRSLNVATAFGIAIYALRYGSGCQGAEFR